MGVATVAYLDHAHPLTAMALPAFVASAVDSWAAFYGDHQLVSVDASAYLHLAGLVVGGGTALAADRQRAAGGPLRAEARAASVAALDAVAPRRRAGARRRGDAPGVLMTRVRPRHVRRARALYWSKMGLVGLLLLNGARPPRRRARASPASGRRVAVAGPHLGGEPGAVAGDPLRRCLADGGGVRRRRVNGRCETRIGGVRRAARARVRRTDVAPPRARDRSRPRRWRRWPASCCGPGRPAALPVVEATGAQAGPDERSYPLPAADGVTIDRDGAGDPRALPAEGATPSPSPARTRTRRCAGASGTCASSARGTSPSTSRTAPSSRAARPATWTASRSGKRRGQRGRGLEPPLPLRPAEGGVGGGLRGRLTEARLPGPAAGVPRTTRISA